MAVDFKRGTRNMGIEMIVISCANTEMGAVRVTDDKSERNIPRAVVEYRGDDDEDGRSK